MEVRISNGRIDLGSAPVVDAHLHGFEAERLTTLEAIRIAVGRPARY